MATKTITIDVEAYRRLKRAQKPNESFSQTIKRVVHKPMDLNSWLKEISANPMSPEAVEAVEKQVAERRRPSNRKR